MIIKKSMVNTFATNMFVVILFITLTVGYFLISNKYNRFEDQIRRYQEEYIDFRKRMIRDEVDLVISNIYFKKEQLAKREHTDPEIAKKEILDWINRIRIREDQYVVVNKYDGTILAHYKTERIGQNMWDFTDQNGVKAVQKVIEASKHHDGGYVSYVGSIRPSTGRPGKKITYARSIPEWEWTVLTGVYMDDIETSIAQKRAELQESIKQDLAKIGFIFVFVILVSFIITKSLTSRMKSNLGILSAYFQKAASRSEQIDTAQIHFAEFQELARSVNHMTIEKNQINEALNQHQAQLEDLVRQRTKSLEESNRKLSEENHQRMLIEKEKEIKILQLEEALREVKTLRGLLPICSSCKKIRNDSGYWQQIESYIETRSDAVFSHGFCPECLEKLYGDQDWFKKK